VLPGSCTPQPGSSLLAHLAAPKLLELQQALEALVSSGPVVLQILMGTSTSGGPAPVLHQVGGSRGVPSNGLMMGVGIKGGASSLSPSVPLQGDMLSEAGRAVAYAAQAGTCLDVLQMVAENAMAPFRLSSASGTPRSASSSASPSPRPLSATVGGPAQRSPGLGLYGLPTAGPRQGQLQGGPQGVDQQQAAAQQEMAAEVQVVQLVGAVWERVQPVLPHLGGITSVVAPAADFFACSLRCLPFTSRPDPLICSIQLLSKLMPQALLLPKVMALLCVCVEAHSTFRLRARLLSVQAAMSVDPGAGAQLGGASQNQQAPSGQQQHQHSGSSGGAMVAAMSQEASDSLLASLHNCLVTGCQQAVATVDPDFNIPLIKLCCNVLRHMPDVCALPSTLEALLSMTLHTGRTYDMEQCRQWLDWAPLLCTAPFQPGSSLPTSSSASALGPPCAAGAGQGLVGSGAGEASSGPSAGGTGSQPQQSTAGPGLSLTHAVTVQTSSVPQVVHVGQLPEGLARLAGMLDAGSAGPQLILTLLMAASGDMPPDMVMPIATALHQIWSSVGTAR
jgi:hypothetical protein